MNMRSRFAMLRAAGLAAQSAALALAVSAAYAPVGCVAGWLDGQAGLITSAVAATLCLLGAEVALALSHLIRSPRYRLFGTLGGMLPRMGVPLALGLVLQIHGGMLADAGLLIYLAVFYPLTLSLELAISLPAGDEPENCGVLSQNATL